jgi:hypothetical protein
MRQPPKPVWHPLPVTEVCIAAGIVGMTVGLVRGGQTTAALPFVAGFCVTALGVFELTAREHFAGYRRHTTLLAFMCAATLHGASVVVLPFQLIGLGAIALDLIAFTVACSVLDTSWRRRTQAPKATEGDRPA